jgi:HemY protein
LATLRAVAFVVFLAALTAAAVWLADHPGDVVIHWQGYAISSSVAVLVAAVALISIVCALVYRAWRWLRDGPRRLARNRAARRRERGYQALTEGLVAAAAGDAKVAHRLGRESGRLLDNPFNLLLLAQAAQLDGNEAAARRHFGAMLDHPETEFLGLRGLIVQANKAGDRETALDYARRAYALRPETEWVNTALFDLEVGGGDWRAAQRTLEAAARRKAVAPDDAQRRRAVLLAERARTAQEAGRDDEALALAREAHRLAGDLVAATVLAASLLTVAGKSRAAAKLIEESWAREPHPELARTYADAAPEETSLERFKRIESLAKRREDHPESQIALAEAALEAELWGAARSHLEAAARQRPTRRVFRLLATLEERENADAAAARSWLLRAAGAPPDAAWLCDKCGASSAAWGARCAACGGFDTLAWKMPPIAADPAPPEAAAALPATREKHEPGPPAAIVDAALARE